jgi:hypothetical protein
MMTRVPAQRRGKPGPRGPRPVYRVRSRAGEIDPKLRAELLEQLALEIQSWVDEAIAAGQIGEGDETNGLSPPSKKPTPQRPR